MPVNLSPTINLPEVVVATFFFGIPPRDTETDITDPLERRRLYDISKQMVTGLVFDQSVYAKKAIRTVLHEGWLGLLLTNPMILLFLGSFPATTAVVLSIPPRSWGFT